MLILYDTLKFPLNEYLPCVDDVQILFSLFLLYFVKILLLIWSIYIFFSILFYVLKFSCHKDIYHCIFTTTLFHPSIYLSKLNGFSSVQSLSRVRLFATPWIAACQASLSITNSRSSLRLMSIQSVMPSSHLILCRPLLLLPPIPPSISLFQWVNSSHEVAKVLEFQL